MVVGYDSVDANRRKISLYASVALRDLVKDSSVAAWITEHALNAETRQVTFQEVFDAFPSYANIFDSTVDPLGTLTGSSLSTLEGALDAYGYTFKIGMVLINDSVANPEFKPIAMPALDIYDDTVNNHDDVAFAWLLDANNNVSQINIWEEKAWSTEAPVIAVTFIPQSGPAQVTGEDETEQRQETSEVIDWTVRITQFRIDYHYDNSANDEYYITSYKAFVPYSGTGGYAQTPFIRRWNIVYGSCNRGPVGEYEIALVKKNKVHDIINDVFQHYFCGLQPSREWTDQNKLFFNTFEYDWFAGYKFLGSVTYPGGQYVRLSGRMSEPWEWYQWDPNNGFGTGFINTRVSPMGHYWLGVNNSFQYNSPKGGFLTMTLRNSCF